MPKLISHSEQDTADFGFALGRAIEGGTVIGLTGTLGAGKTRLTQAIAAGLDIPGDRVVSPTFTICIPYQGRLGLLHLDAYRIRSDDEVDELGLDECVEHGAVLIVEWADRIARLLPPMDLEIDLVVKPDGSRQITLVAQSELGERLVNRSHPDAG